MRGKLYLFQTKKTHLLYIKGYNMVKNNFLVEVTFKFCYYREYNLIMDNLLPIFGCNLFAFLVCV